MKARCVGSDEDAYYFKVESGRPPKVGTVYTLEDATKGTGAQNRAREALIQAYWRWGGHPKYGGDGYSDFRDKLKRDLGEGFDRFIYVDIRDGKPRIHEVKGYHLVPEEIKIDPDMRDMIRGKLKSCSRYGKKANQRFIDNIIMDGSANGCNTDKWNEILEGMKGGA